MVELPHHAHGARFVGIGRAEAPLSGLRIVLGDAVAVIIRNSKIQEGGVVVLGRGQSPKPAGFDGVNLAEIPVHMADAKVIKAFGIPEGGGAGVPSPRFDAINGNAFAMR